MADVPAIIAAVAPQYGLPVALIKAFCEVESAWNPWAMRYEPTYRWLVGDKLTMTQTERVGQMISWGLMQLMGGVARELGFDGAFPQLCDPGVGLDYGCRHLQHFYQRHGNWPDAIASYNAGSPRRVGESYVNQSYVDKVTAAWNRYEQPTTI